MTLEVRQAVRADAVEMCEIQTQAFRDWGKESMPTPEGIAEDYIDHPDRVSCVVAVIDGKIVGFQSVQGTAVLNKFDLETGWGAIGTYVSLDATRQGIGSAMFEANKEAARNAGLEHLDAWIGASDPRALGYYDAMGFVDYITTDDYNRKRFDL